MSHYLDFHRICRLANEYRISSERLTEELIQLVELLPESPGEDIPVLGALYQRCTESQDWVLLEAAVQSVNWFAVHLKTETDYERCDNWLTRCGINHIYSMKLSLPDSAPLELAARVTELYQRCRRRLEVHWAPGCHRWDIQSLTKEVASQCASITGPQSFPELKNLNEDCAAILGNHFGYLTLNGLTFISDKSAKLLSRHRGSVDLSGLRFLSEMGAESLTKIDGDLDLSGLRHLSNQAARHLGKFYGSLNLAGLPFLSPHAAKSLANHRGTLNLSGLGLLTEELCHCLEPHDGDVLLNLECLRNSPFEGIVPICFTSSGRGTAAMMHK